MCICYWVVYECQHPQSEHVELCNKARRNDNVCGSAECPSPERVVTATLKEDCHACRLVHVDRREQGAMSTAREQSEKEAESLRRKEDEDLRTVLTESRKGIPSFEDEIAEALAISQHLADQESTEAIERVKRESMQDVSLMYTDDEYEEMLRHIRIQSMREWDGRGGCPDAGPSDDLPWTKRQGISDKTPAVGHGGINESVDLDPQGRGKGKRHSTPVLNSVFGSLAGSSHSPRASPRALPPPAPSTIGSSDPPRVPAHAPPQANSATSVRTRHFNVQAASSRSGSSRHTPSIGSSSALVSSSARRVPQYPVAYAESVSGAVHSSESSRPRPFAANAGANSGARKSVDSPEHPSFTPLTASSVCPPPPPPSSSTSSKSPLQGRFDALTLSRADTQSLESEYLGAVRDDQDRRYLASLEADREKAKKRRAAERAVKAKQEANGDGECETEFKIEPEGEPQAAETLRAKRLAFLERARKAPPE